MLIFGGTSVSSPIIASFYALAENPASGDELASYPYAHASSLNDVTSGTNGSCGGSYLCTAKPGFDGPTGLGTPNGTAAFARAGAADFTIGASPSTVGGLTPNSTGSTTINLAAVGGFTGAVNLSTSVTPSTGLGASFSSPSVTLPGTTQSTLNLNVGATPASQYTVTVTGTPAAGGPAHSVTVTVNVVAPDFSIAAAPSTLIVPSNTSGASTLSLASINGFSGAVNLSASVSPSTGLAASFSSPSVTLPGTTQSTLNLNMGPSGANQFTVTVTATPTAGGAPHVDGHGEPHAARLHPEV